ncbi:hypothetical protein [Arundinibacter roseus]|uniref:Uncharacterized protein n=1 Tax=Arundinibacter roseus TaxID=2070510 RepID=A0A4R4K9F8_9BACT|nr:hypothetical protein [Arundinibacter roseus]TDB64143.1 hypothetical protein EZE20_14480 [Arundinibacter roseus]
MSSLIDFFIRKIENEQSAGTAIFPAGLFPAHRSNDLIGYSRPDTTLFFSTIICFTLQKIFHDLPEVYQERIRKVVDKVTPNYEDFKNKDGLKTYNFWKTKPSRHFPNGYLFRHFEHFRIPDDLDDTAFVYLTTAPSGDELLWLKQKLTQHANGHRQWIRNTYPEYKPLRAYSTWFGKNMYIEFDACVLSNMLYLIFERKLPLNDHDQDSLTYIRSVVETRRYLREPFRCAHQYPHTALIIYHVARLMAAFDPPELQPVKSRLIADCRALLQTEPHVMCRILLASSLLRLGEMAPKIDVSTFTEETFKGFYFFIAGLLTAYEHPLLYRLASNRLFHMYWTCPAHAWVLLLEYEVLYEKSQVFPAKITA